MGLAATSPAAAEPQAATGPATVPEGPDRNLAELLLYISQRSEGDPQFGATKLKLLLFYADFLAYLTLARSITGQEYLTRPDAPLPAGFTTVWDRLRAAGELAVRPTELRGLRQERPLALREAELGDFQADDIALVEQVLSRFWGRSPAEVRTACHERFVGWGIALPGETISYATALLGDRDLTPQELEFAERVLVPMAKECLREE